MELPDFLLYSMTPAGIMAIVGVILSIAVEYIPWFEVMTPKEKRVVFVLLNFLIPLVGWLGYYSLGYVPVPDTLMGVVESLWSGVVVPGFVAATTGTLAHTRKLPT